MTQNSIKGKTRLRSVLGWFFVLVSVMIGVLGLTMAAGSMPVYAVPDEVEEIELEETEEEPQDEGAVQNEDSVNARVEEAPHNGCMETAGGVGWAICNIAEAASKAVDWMHEKIESFLEINPISTEDGSPIYEIWKYCRDITNIVFIIFLLVVIYSQITGLGITNYGIKKVLPKLIMVAVLVNLSFLICNLAVDLSNIVGNGLRGFLDNVETIAMEGATQDAVSKVSMTFSGVFGIISGAVGITAAVVAFEGGVLWMLFPILLGALISVASGFLAIALRQALVALLVMISPLAFVMYLLPNTESLFKKWRQLLVRMLVFYPMFSLLFGAANLAGFAIMSSASDGFGVIMGLAVRVFPLVFSWSLMRMSGTIVGDITDKFRGLAEKPLAANRAWADSHRQLTRARNLASKRAFTPSLFVMQRLSDRKYSRDARSKYYSKIAEDRGMAYDLSKNYKRGKKGLGSESEVLSRRGEKMYEMQNRDAKYQRMIVRHENNFNAGVGGLAANRLQKARLEALDNDAIRAFDALKIEKARGEQIEFDNAKGFHNRMQDAINAHFDEKYKDNVGYERHRIGDRTEAEKRYAEALKIMDGNADHVQYAASEAAAAYSVRSSAYQSKMQKYFELTPPTADVVYRMRELSLRPDSAERIDAILPGMRVLLQRGDTDLVREQIENVLHGGLKVGSYASQSLANFMLTEVKDADPWLRRFGKYINLETARAFNPGGDRKQLSISYEEYIKGYHEEPDGTIMYAKKGMKELMAGTSLDGVERTAYKNFDESLKEAYTIRDRDGNKVGFDMDGFLKKRGEIQNAIGPQFISASLKYLSGSEQLQSAVSFLTGYEYKQVKNADGTPMIENGEPVYEWRARWDDGGDLSSDPDKARDYFQKKTEQYIKDQTPSQILGLRSDYRDPMMEHLANARLSNSKDGDKYKRELAEIQTRYGDLPADEAMKRRKADAAKVKMQMAGKQMRQILGESGKLEQIYTTKRSGAANNAKDWVRDWLYLDDREKLLREVDEYRESKRQSTEERYRSETGDVPPLDDEDGDFDIYDEATINNIIATAQARWGLNGYDLRHMDREQFYQEAKDYLEDTFGEDSRMAIEWENNYNLDLTKRKDAEKLYREFLGLLGNRGLYPDR